MKSQISMPRKRPECEKVSNSACFRVCLPPVSLKQLLIRVKAAKPMSTKIFIIILRDYFDLLYNTTQRAVLSNNRRYHGWPLAQVPG